MLYQLWIVGCLAVLTSAAYAGEGVIEINQAVVQQQGGFPFTIGSPGSYRLTGNLNGSAGADVIDVTAGSVSIDLNGFAITAGSAGISGATAAEVSVRNGTISGTTGDGIHLGSHAVVEDVRVIGNAGTGITVSDGSRISRNTVSGNGGAGITIIGTAALVAGNTINGNGNTGLNMADQTTGYAGNVMFGNSGNSTIGSYAGQRSGGTQIGQNLCNGNVCP